jgi:hypothetical protein
MISYFLDLDLLMCMFNINLYIFSKLFLTDGDHFPKQQQQQKFQRLPLHIHSCLNIDSCDLAELKMPFQI